MLVGLVKASGSKASMQLCQEQISAQLVGINTHFTEFGCRASGLFSSLFRLLSGLFSLSLGLFGLLPLQPCRFRRGGDHVPFWREKPEFILKNSQI
jgi:hypothetical protein